MRARSHVVGTQSTPAGAPLHLRAVGPLLACVVSSMAPAPGWGAQSASTSPPASASAAAAAGSHAGAAAGEPVSPAWGPIPPAPMATNVNGGAAAVRAGVLRLGLGLEGPFAGVMTGTGGGRAMYGYTVGGSFSWELVPSVLVRAYSSVGRGYGARAPIAYARPAALPNAPGGPTRRRQDASWLSIEVGGGGAYLFRSASSEFVPYVGGDVAAAFAGYEYAFSAGDPLTQQPPRSGDTGLRAPDRHEAFGWTWSGGVRAGVRFSMLRWLATQAEIGVSYCPAPEREITNTYTSLGVHSVAEGVWLARTTFSVRLGI